MKMHFTYFVVIRRQVAGLDGGQICSDSAAQCNRRGVGGFVQSAQQAGVARWLPDSVGGRLDDQRMLELGRLLVAKNVGGCLWTEKPNFATSSSSDALAFRRRPAVCR
jgi:hypothetical protein